MGVTKSPRQDQPLEQPEGMCPRRRSRAETALAWLKALGPVVAAAATIIVKFLGS